MRFKILNKTSFFRKSTVENHYGYSLQWRDIFVSSHELGEKGKA